MDGVILINKEKGMTSQNVVSKVKRILNLDKAGHAGTLDPNATGVLPILVNKGTKLSKYLIEHDKIYIATLKLGEKRSTGDVEGEVTEKDEIDLKNISKENILEVLESFKGVQSQIPPIYSALKVNGKKLYDYARNGEEVEIKPRKINIYDIKLLEIYDESNEIKFEVSCSKGTYIRVLCEDIASRLNTVGYMSDLQRTRVNNFDISESITISELEENKDIKIIEVEDLFLDKEKINLNNRKEELFLNGVMLTFEYPDGIYRIYNNDKFIGLGTVQNKLLKRDIVL